MYVYIYKHIQIYVNYIAAVFRWCIFFQHPYRTSRAPNFGDYCATVRPFLGLSLKIQERCHHVVDTSAS
jgi:hypothetical protein